MVGFDCPEVFPLRYCWSNVVFPTPESPKITIFRKFFFFYILVIYQNIVINIEIQIAKK